MHPIFSITKKQISSSYKICFSCKSFMKVQNSIIKCSTCDSYYHFLYDGKIHAICFKYKDLKIFIQNSSINNYIMFTFNNVIYLKDIYSFNINLPIDLESIYNRFETMIIFQ